MKTRTILALAGALAAASCAHGGPPPGFGGGGAGGFSFPVAAAPLTRGQISQTFDVTGTVTPLLTADLSSVASGTVLAVNAQIGQHVSKGELLVQIDDGPLQAQLQSSQASLESAQAKLAQTRAGTAGDQASTNAGLLAARAANQTAQTNLQRDQSLFKEGYVSQQQLDQAWSDSMAAQAQLRSAQVAAQNAQVDPQAQSVAQANLKDAQASVDVAQSQVSLIESQIGQTQVRAPFDGVVTWRHVDPGSLASPNTTLMEVAQLDPVYIDTGISGSSLPFVHVGTQAKVAVSTVPGRTWTGTVEYFNLASEPGSLTYLARIRIPNSDLALRGGMVADVSFVQAHKANVILAPRAAVFQTDAGMSMFVIDSGKAKQLPVDVGLENDQQMEVSAPGLKPGTMAILNHAATLQPGMPVMVLPPQGGAPGASGAGSKPGASSGKATPKPGY
ncbi:MAG TPA: efflux RND transporter periplasmic adaptor subunit [Candidatus Eremiobacteraceae bacterium]|nr:efflux RND transporter periplasmic adaptor subunit [Candidatus Eremiobacteraceae bacterium]